MNLEPILVTGGAGYLGSRLVRKLLHRGRRVRVLDNLLHGEDGIAGLYGEPNFEFRHGDVRSVRDVGDALRGVRTVVALAALDGEAASHRGPVETRETNYKATRCVLYASRGAGVRRLVFASSCGVYGAGDPGNAFDEESALGPMSDLARMRALSEDVLRRECGRVEVVILRLPALCGVSGRMRFDLMVNGMTARAVAEGRVYVPGGVRLRPHLHVDDAAEAFVRAIEAPSLHVAGGVFNVGGSRLNLTAAEVADTVARVVPRAVVECLPESGDAAGYRVSFERIRDRLGFSPERDVGDAVREVHAFLQSRSLTAGTVKGWVGDR